MTNDHDKPPKPLGDTPKERVFVIVNIVALFGILFFTIAGLAVTWKKAGWEMAILALGIWFVALATIGTADLRQRDDNLEYKKKGPI